MRVWESDSEKEKKVKVIDAEHQEHEEEPAAADPAAGLTDESAQV